jgi:hypothetical protein
MASGALRFVASIDERFKLMIAFLAEVFEDWHSAYPFRWPARTPFKIIAWEVRKSNLQSSLPAAGCEAAICKP